MKTKTLFLMLMLLSSALTNFVRAEGNGTERGGGGDEDVPYATTIYCCEHGDETFPRRTGQQFVCDQFKCNTVSVCASYGLIVDRNPFGNP